MPGWEIDYDEETVNGYPWHEVPHHVQERVAEEAYNDALISADLTEAQWAAVDAPEGLKRAASQWAAVDARAENPHELRNTFRHRLRSALADQQRTLDELNDVFFNSESLAGWDDGYVEHLLGELKAASQIAADWIDINDGVTLQALESAAKDLSGRRATLAAWQRSLLAQLPQEPAERLLYVLALAGDPQACAELKSLLSIRAELGLERTSRDLLAVEILALLAALAELASDTQRLIKSLRVLLSAVVLAPSLYLRRYHPRPPERLRGSVDRTAPPVAGVMSAAA